MCGIIFARKTGKDKTPMNMKALDIFENQRKRGTEGFGIVKIFKDKTFKVDRATEGYKFMWDIHMDPVDTIMVHHRTPTSTPNLTDQTHPLHVSNGSLKYNYLVIHNGMISNDDELKTEHEKLGFVYQTAMKEWNGTEKFNDSEALAIELSRYIEGQEKKYRTTGSAAFIALQINKKTQKAEKIFFGRHGSSPLLMAKTRGSIILASENIGEEIKEDILYSCELDDKMELTKKKLAIEPETTKISPYSWIRSDSRSATAEIETQKYMRRLREREREDECGYRARYNSDGIATSDDDLPTTETTEILTEQEQISSDVVDNVMDIIDQAVSEIEMGLDEDEDMKTYADMIYQELLKLNKKARELKEKEWAITAQKDYKETKMAESNLGTK
jgi:glucosamine 6-phosphate synthetase-like amidotransferase/phosphosugar isomerase protein